jgi:hypothetical protein
VLGSQAQELDPKDPALIADGLTRANVVVVGTFRVAWFYPWFDGWHYSGAIHAEEILYGDRSANRVVPLRWKQGYGSTCLISEKLSRFQGERGIWLVAQTDGEWQLLKTRIWGGGPFQLDSRETVRQLLKQKR